MMTSRRPRDVGGGSFASRRGHGNQLSISDTSNHITETIGTMYGDDDDYQTNESRPLSFIAAPRGGEQIPDRRELELSPADEHRLKLVRSTSSETGSLNGNHPGRLQTQPAQTQGRGGLSRTSSNGGPTSPVSPGGSMSPTLRDMRHSSDSFPLTNIDNPNDIAQELSNLQALRRLSMDVSNNSDPDLLPFQGMSLMAMPSIAPKGHDDADPSRLLWVPAGVHPELAPSEFKNFVEKRVQSMKRRSSESSLSPDSLEGGDSGGLRRKKSMLSRQIVNGGGHGADGYMDGAERLERKRSQRHSEHSVPELSLDELMKDPSKAVRKLTLESQGIAEDSSNAGDMPILPMAPGTGLRRSTRTTYRKGGSLKNRQGSLKNNERLPFSQRMASKKGESGEGVSPGPGSPMDAPIGYGLVRVQSEPVPENFSRPSKAIRRQQPFKTDSIDVQGDSQEQSQSQSMRPSGPKRTISSDNAPHFTTTPQIVETPAIEEEDEVEPRNYDVNRPFPQRSSSQRGALQNVSHQPPAAPLEPPSRSDKRPSYSQQEQVSSQRQLAHAGAQPQRSPNAPDQSFADAAQTSPSLASGSASRTDTLTFIPTFSAPEEKRSDRRSKKDEGGSKSSSWKWFKSDDREKKKKEEETKKSKAKALVEKGHDNVRLDVLQTSIDTALHKGRESILLERDSIDSKLEEERRKESVRKSGEPKKEKDGLFSSFFGGGKKKGDRDSSNRKSHLQRPLSPEPAPYRPLRPDIDYHWTRFPILEERAIYRMAHIKLANPRRALYSQVLLSNFMYAYLAKVQAMHPQIQVPQSPQQRRQQEEERKRREQEQQYLEQQHAQDSIDRYNFEYHRSGDQYSDPSMQHEAGDYPEAAEIYDYDHGKDDTQAADYVDGYGEDKDYYSYGNQNGQRHDKEEEMW